MKENYSGRQKTVIDVALKQGYQKSKKSEDISAVEKCEKRTLRIKITVIYMLQIDKAFWKKTYLTCCTSVSRKKSNLI